MNIPTKYLAIGCMALFAYQTNAKDVERKNSSPVQFMANSGQITNQHGVVRHNIDAKIEANGVVMFVGNGQLHYQWTKNTSPQPSPKEREIISGNGFEKQVTSPCLSRSIAGERQGEVSIYRMDVTLVGANTNAPVLFEEPTGYYENYYLAHTGENGVVAKGYSKVTYKNVYPNIDWVIYTPSAPLKGSGIMESQNTSSPSGEVGRGVKYDFIIHPGGNPADIRLRYDGATELKLVEGALVAVTPYGTITEDAPYSYNAETKTEVASTYILQGNELRFDVAQQNGILVIDPALKWATYFGGTQGERVYDGVAADTNGQAYMGGFTNSSSNIATTGAHLTVYGSGTTFLAKFNTAGQQVWGTYYGGQGARAIALDHHKNIVICGEVDKTSTAATTIGAYQTVHGNATYLNWKDMFLAKFDSNGVRLWGTYYGDSSDDGGLALAIDRAGYIYLAGFGGYASMSTPGTFRPYVNVGGYNFNISKFSPSGHRVWGTFVPEVTLNGIAVDDSAYVYICGSTSSDTGIATTGTHQTNRSSTNITGSDGFIMKFDSTGQRVWGTYYGGTSGEGMYDIAANNNEVYVVGASASSGGIATAGAHQSTRSGGAGDGFIARFTPQGQQVWGSYFGGTSAGNEELNSVTIRPEGDILVGGFTQSSGLATQGAYQTTIPANTYAGITAQFSNSGSLLWASYFCGNNGTSFQDIAYAKNKLYLAGGTEATTGIATNGAHQTSYNGNNDAILVQFELADTLAYIATPILRSGLCAGDTLHVPYKVTSNFRSSNTFTIQLSNATGSFASATTLATINGNTANTVSAIVPGTLPNGTGYKLRIISTAPADTSEPSVQSLAIYSRPVNVTAGSNGPVCSGDTIKLNSGTTTTGVTYSWAGPGGFASVADDTIIANSTVAQSGNYYITISNNGCMVKDTVAVVVNQTPQNVTATSNGGVCSGDTMKLMSSTTTGGVTYAWAGPNNYNTQNVTIPNVQLSHAGTYTVTITLGNCSDTASTVVTVDQSAVINIVALTPVSICKGDTAQFYGFPNFAGTNPQMQWQINGVNVPGATAALFKTHILVNGDKVRMTVTPNTTCPGTRMSNEIPITVQDLKAPQVSITADAGPSLYPNEPINFTAVATDAGNAPNYQWRKNGIDIGGATGAVWGANANALKDGDNICVLVTSTYACPSPDTALSNCIQLDIRLSVDEVVNNNSIKVYPNPVKGTLRITSTTVIESITINNLLGQQLLQQTAKGNTADVDMSALAAGVYVVKVNGVYAVRVTKE